MLLQVGLLVLKYIYRDELAGKLPEIFKLLRNLTQQKTGLEYLESLLRYLASASPKLSDQDLQVAVKEAIKEGGEQIMPTLAQRRIEDIELLRAIRLAIKSVNTLEELQEFYKDYIPEAEHHADSI